MNPKIFKFTVNETPYFVEAYGYTKAEAAIKNKFKVDKVFSSQVNRNELNIIWSHKNIDKSSRLELAVKAYNLINGTGFFVRENKIMNKNKNQKLSSDDAMKVFDTYKLCISKEDLYSKSVIDKYEKQRRLVYEIKLLLQDDFTFTSSYDKDVAAEMFLSNKLYNNTGYLVPVNQQEGKDLKLFVFNSHKEQFDNIYNRAKECDLMSVNFNDNCTYEDVLNQYETTFFISKKS